jgi:cobalt/nickel transport protein
MVLVFVTTLLEAHFQAILPQNDVVTSSKKQNIELKFMHPFEQNYMNMAKPDFFGYFLDGKKVDLTDKLTSEKIEGYQAWSYKTKFKDIGDYIYFVDPKPYFEPSEGKFIHHITKTVIDAYNAGEGWDAKLGLKAEIVPLVRPYSLYSGNIFKGVVYYKGKPASNVTVEVEYLNKGSKLKAPTDNHITQVIKTDKNGIFSFVMPKSGWWGFAALIDDDVKIKKDGKEYPVELGAVYWLKTYEMK